MLFYFVPSDDVIHPETREVLIVAGALYPLESLAGAAYDFGFDSSKGSIIVAKDEDEALRVYEAINQ